MWYDTTFTNLHQAPPPTCNNVNPCCIKKYLMKDCLWIKVEVVCIQFKYNWNQSNFQDSIFASLNWIIDFTNILIARLLVGTLVITLKWCNTTMAILWLRGHPMDGKDLHYTHGSPLQLSQSSTNHQPLLTFPTVISCIQPQHSSPAIKNNNISSFQKPQSIKVRKLLAVLCVIMPGLVDWRQWTS